MKDYWSSQTKKQSEGSCERYLPLFTQKKILWGLIFAYMPKPEDTFRRLSEMASLNQQSMLFNRWWRWRISKIYCRVNSINLRTMKLSPPSIAVGFLSIIRLLSTRGEHTRVIQISNLLYSIQYWSNTFVYTPNRNPQSLVVLYLCLVWISASV